MSKKIVILFVALLLIGGGAFFLLRGGQNSNESITQNSNKNNEEDSLNIDELLVPVAAADFYEDENSLTVNKGSVTVKRASGEEESVEEETTVSIGDTIVVNEESMATIHWFDDSISRLQAGTEMTIDKASYNPENIAETDINLNVIKGEIWSKVQSLTDEDSEFLSYTGSTVAGVRGSVFNFIASDDGVIVESIKHAAFVGEWDKESGDISEQTFIIDGHQAKVSDSSNVEVAEIPEERFEQDWFKDNKANDERDGALLKEKNIERINKQAGILPGEDGYERKMRLIRKRMEAIQDPVKKAEMQAQLAQMKTYEAVAMFLKNPDSNPEEIAKNLERARNIIESSDLSNEVKEQIKKRMQSELKILSRTIEGTTSHDRLSEMKEVLHDNQMSLETDEEKKSLILKKALESRLFELMDGIRNEEIEPDRIKLFLERYKEELTNLGADIEGWDGFKEIALQFMRELEKMEGVELNLDEFQKLKELLGEEKPVVIKRDVYIPPPEPTPEPRDVIIDEAPFHQGESDV